MAKLVKKVQLHEFTDSRGQLIASEFFSDHGVLAKRIYVLKNVPDFAKRGGHAHKELKQIFFCLQGSFRITVSNGVSKESFILSQDNPGILLESGLWRELYDFSNDTICLVVASEPYDPNDYINNFEDYLSWKTDK